MNMKLVAITSIVLVAMAAAGVALAGKHGAGHEDGGRPHGPPEMAFTVCAEAQEGENCSFSARHGDVTGQCSIKRSEMVCVPEGHKKHGGHHQEHASNDYKGGD